MEVNSQMVHVRWTMIASVNQYASESQLQKWQNPLKPSLASLGFQEPELAHRLSNNSLILKDSNQFCF